jgi:hypothetical protein
MGRELKRVALDFNHPIGQLWPGFVNPHYHECRADDCHGGYTAAGKWLDALCRLIVLCGSQALEAPRAAELRRRGQIYPHPYLEEWGTAPRAEVPREVHERIRRLPERQDRFRALDAYLRANPRQLLPLTPEMYSLVKGLNNGQGFDFMSGCTVPWTVGKTLIRAAGLDADTWGVCTVCKGSGQDPATEKAYEDWEPEEPPAGPGYQLWETTSEGSPASPVFETLDALCEWCEENATTFGSAKASAVEWCKMLDDGFVCHREGNMVFV